MSTQDDMIDRGKKSAIATIDAAGTNPYNADDGLLVPVEPTDQFIEAEKQNMGRDELTEEEWEAYRDGYAQVMDAHLERVDEVGWEAAREETLSDD